MICRCFGVCFHCCRKFTDTNSLIGMIRSSDKSKYQTKVVSKIGSLRYKQVPCGRQCVHLCTNIFFSSPLVVFALDVKVDNGKRDNDMYQRWPQLCYLLTWNICVCSMNAINMLHLKWFMFIASHAILVCLCVIQICAQIEYIVACAILCESAFSIETFNVIYDAFLEISHWYFQSIEY